MLPGYLISAIAFLELRFSFHLMEVQDSQTTALIQNHNKT